MIPEWLKDEIMKTIQNGEATIIDYIKFIINEVEKNENE